MRAWRNTRPVDPIFSVVPAIVTTVVTTYVAWLEVRGDVGVHTRTYTVPAAAGLAALAVVLFVLHGIEFLYRLVTGKARAGRPRALHGLRTNAVVGALRANHPPLGQFGFVGIDPATIETESFARELHELFTRADWPIGNVGPSPLPWGRMTRGIEIFPPEGGNPGLEALAKALNNWGYRTVVNSGEGGGTATVTVGEVV
jgi:hypothetical protein